MTMKTYKLEKLKLSLKNDKDQRLNSLFYLNKELDSIAEFDLFELSSLSNMLCQVYFH